jgi:hypothetical protein
LRQGSKHGRPFHAAVVALVGLVGLVTVVALPGCRHVPPAPAVQLPPGVDGYQCYRREKTASGFVYAKGYPDYRGSYTSLTMGWETGTVGGYLPEVKLVWTFGPDAIAPPGWISVNQAVQGELPPLKSMMYLRLSSGEVIEREFIEPKRWRRWKRSELRAEGFGGLIHSEEPAVRDAFSRATWADVEVVDPQGTTLTHTRLDLSHMQDDLAVMRRLGKEVEASINDYEHRCAPIHIEVDAFGASASGSPRSNAIRGA